jgi:hypothetical protein
MGLIDTLVKPGSTGRMPTKYHGMMKLGDALQMCENVRLGSSSGDQHSIVVVAPWFRTIPSHECFVSASSTDTSAAVPWSASRENSAMSRNCTGYAPQGTPTADEAMRVVKYFHAPAMCLSSKMPNAKA